MLLQEQLTKRIIGIYYDVYNELGSGFLESVYESAMEIALTQAGFQTQRQAPVQVWFRETLIGEYRADMVVEDTVLLELKACKEIDPAHESQVLHYLRATTYEVGLILNFGPEAKFKRFIYENSRKKGIARRSA